MKNVLVLCTGNSCRYIMAAALNNHLGQGKFSAVSAGSFPVGYVHPQSIETLARHGVSAGEPRSKSWDEFENRNFDQVVTVCDQAASESCPVFLGQCEKIHWSIPDPAKADGTNEEIEKAFDDVFQMIKNRIEKELL